MQLNEGCTESQSIEVLCKILHSTIICKIMHCTNTCKKMHSTKICDVHCTSKLPLLRCILTKKDKEGESAQLHSYLFVCDVRYDESDQIGFKICLKLINQLCSISSLSSLAWQRGVMASSYRLRSICSC